MSEDNANEQVQEREPDYLPLGKGIQVLPDTPITTDEIPPPLPPVTQPAEQSSPPTASPAK